jgi:anti-anti-sigma factor
MGPWPAVRIDVIAPPGLSRVVRVSGDVDVLASHALRVRLAEAVTAGGATVVDLAGVALLSAAAVGVLAQTADALAASGRRLRLVLTEEVRRVLAAAHVLDRVDVELTAAPGEPRYRPRPDPLPFPVPGLSAAGVLAGALAEAMRLVDAPAGAAYARVAGRLRLVAHRGVGAGFVAAYRNLDSTEDAYGAALCRGVRAATVDGLMLRSTPVPGAGGRCRAVLCTMHPDPPAPTPTQLAALRRVAGQAGRWLDHLPGGTGG